MKAALIATFWTMTPEACEAAKEAVHAAAWTENARFECVLLEGAPRFAPLPKEKPNG